MSCLSVAGLAFLGGIFLTATISPSRAAAQSPEPAAAGLTIAKSEESFDHDPHLRHSERQAFYHRQKYRLGSLLADRFHLKFRTQAKDMPDHILVVDNNGLKLSSVKESDGPMNQLFVGSGEFIAHGMTLSQFADVERPSQN